jgi:sugar phosphate isomerase/epimerase
MSAILVQLSDRSWTKQALHLACSAARNNGCEVVLLYLMSIRNVGLLGTGIGAEPPSSSVDDDLDEYAQIAEDYGVELALQPMTYESLDSALCQAAARLHAVVCFAHVPAGKWRWLHRMHLRSLRRQLERCDCRLNALDSLDQREESLPEIVLHPIR